MPLTGEELVELVEKTATRASITYSQVRSADTGQSARIVGSDGFRTRAQMNYFLRENLVVIAISDDGFYVAPANIEGGEIVQHELPDSFNLTLPTFNNEP